HRRIAVLGSTGSIGVNALEVIDSLGTGYTAVAAAAGSNWQTLAKQARQYNLERVVLADTTHINNLRDALAGTPTQVLTGPEHLEILAADPDIDTIIVAVVGSCGLPAVIAAAKAGKTVAIANKESLVVAGCLVMPLAKKHNATILPIDSEHSAILQAMHSGRRHEVSRIILTCSGGPFRNVTAEQMASVTLADALNHPTWNMGPKITIDSATLMNKALEIIEARWLFDIPADQIDVLIHPESIVHSMVEFCDGSLIAQLSNPDMRLPIQYALTYPDRRACPARSLDLSQLKQLNFQLPDIKRFKSLALGFQVAREGGTAGAVFNGANEAAVEAFRAGEIPFTGITELVDKCLRKHQRIDAPTLEDLLAADVWARCEVRQNLPAVQNADINRRR
ncbi:MAG: 1-deoxy-D-xylulose-5-phosphate reductoisomerase, partial [Sedimentisphaerales bacterium]|nr:1-deoxy-D-xylulose-5-phosphate reductoisomerase [Sedimentisphaerales bacterium]